MFSSCRALSRQLDALAAVQHRRPSDLLRDPVAQYVLNTPGRIDRHGGQANPERSPGSAFMNNDDQYAEHHRS